MTKDRDGKRGFSSLIDRDQRLPQQRSKSYQPSKDGVRRLTVEVWGGDPDQPVDHPDNVKLTELVLAYPQRSQAEDGAFDLEYTYSKEGLLTVKATLQRTGETVLNDEVRVFGDRTAPPDIEEEPARLFALSASERTAPRPTHPQRGPARSPVDDPTTGPRRRTPGRRRRPSWQRRPPPGRPWPLRHPRSAILHR